MIFKFPGVFDKYELHLLVHLSEYTNIFTFTIFVTVNSQRIKLFKSYNMHQIIDVSDMYMDVVNYVKEEIEKLESTRKPVQLEFDFTKPMEV